MMGLTEKEHELLDHLKLVEARTPVMPTFSEMAEAMGLRSKSGIHRLIDALVERHYVRRIPRRARAIELLPTARAVPLMKDRPRPNPLAGVSTDAMVAELRRRGELPEIIPVHVAEQ